MKLFLLIKYYIHIFEKYLMSAPSRKGTSFELAPPHEVPNLNERPGRSFDSDSIKYGMYANVSAKTRL